MIELKYLLHYFHMLRKHSQFNFLFEIGGISAKKHYEKKAFRVIIIYEEVNQLFN